MTAPAAASNDAPMPDPNSFKSIADSDVEIVGSLSFQGELLFEGRLKGGSVKGKVLTLGPTARIDGDIEAEALVIFGEVHGNVMVTGKCDLKTSAQLFGNLITSRLVMEDGATLIGDVEIRPAAAAGAPRGK